MRLDKTVKMAQLLISRGRCLAYGLRSVYSELTRKEKKKKKKIFIQMTYIWFYNVYILIVKSFMT